MTPVAVTAAIGVSRGGETIRRIRMTRSRIVDMLIAGLLIAALLSLLISGIYSSDPSCDTIFTSAIPTGNTSSLNISILAVKIIPVNVPNYTMLYIETTREKAAQYMGTNVTAKWVDVYKNVTYWNVLLTRYFGTPARSAKETSLYAFLGLCLIVCLVGVIRIRLPAEEKPASLAQG